MLARRRPEVFQKDIRRGDELAQNLPGLCLAQVERDAFLVSIKRAEARAVALVFGIAPAVGVAAVLGVPTLITSQPKSPSKLPA